MWFKKAVNLGGESMEILRLAQISQGIINFLSIGEDRIAALEQKLETLIERGNQSAAALTALSDLAHKRLDTLTEFLGIDLEFVPGEKKEVAAHYTAKKKEKKSGTAK